jgi:hypothetical protein
MSGDAGVGLVCPAPAFHAPHLHTRAATSERRLAAVEGALESADEHAGRTDAVQTEGDGSSPLLVLHVEKVAVLVEGLLAAEERRREHAGVQHVTVDDGRVAERRGDRSVQAVLDARDADLGSVDVEAGVRTEWDDRRADATGLSGDVAAAVGHCRWCVVLRVCMCGREDFFWQGRGWIDIDSEQRTGEQETGAWTAISVLCYMILAAMANARVYLASIHSLWLYQAVF